MYKTDPLDHQQVERVIKRIYDHKGLKMPEIVHMADPLEGVLAATKYAMDRGTVVLQDALKLVPFMHLGNFDYYVADAIDVPKLDEEGLKSYDLIKDIVEHLGVFWCFDDKVVMCERPFKVLATEDGIVGSDKEPALQWASGRSATIVNGVVYPSLLEYHVNRSPDGD